MALNTIQYNTLNAQNITLTLYQNLIRGNKYEHSATGASGYMLGGAFSSHPI